MRDRAGSWRCTHALRQRIGNQTGSNLFRLSPRCTWVEQEKAELGALSAIAVVGILPAAFALGASLLWMPRWRGDHTWPHRVPFLGGSEPETHAWQRFHSRYYPMVLLFIAFEMEMMFMYPWAVVFVAEGMKAMVEMGMFLAILSIGIVYAWREGVFRWQ